ncbi:hypothetical protein DWUX_338 [Desulfovibrio diazotrophicus]|nr:hypothetical protein DWUX_338 [Desulfovibrio diazotrophicus]
MYPNATRRLEKYVYIIFMYNMYLAELKDVLLLLLVQWRSTEQ